MRRARRLRALVVPIGRGVLAALLVSALALPAFGRDIPPALLAHEAKLRAALTPAQSQHLAALAARLTPKMSVQDALALVKGESDGIVFLMMMEYQKFAQKEAREDKRFVNESKLLSQEAKAAKLAQDNKAIDDQMKEAEQKATNLMNAAQTGMTLGIASGSLQTAGGVGKSLAPTLTPTPAPKTPGALRK